MKFFANIKKHPEIIFVVWIVVFIFSKLFFSEESLVPSISFLLLIVIMFGIGINMVVTDYNELGKETIDDTEELPEDFDFMNVVLVLSASVIKSHKGELKATLDYIRSFFTKQFGEIKTQQYILSLQEILKHDDYDVEKLSERYSVFMPYDYRLQLLRYLFSIACCDGELQYQEYNKIYHIAYCLEIDANDFYSIKALYAYMSYENSRTTGKPLNHHHYKLLGISSSATNLEVRKAYRQMALKYHPDKLTYINESSQKAANEQFQQITLAYEKIKSERGMK